MADVGGTGRGSKSRRKAAAEKAGLNPGESPMHSPWGTAGSNPQGAEQDVLESLGVAARSVLEFEHAFTAAVVEGLAAAESELAKLDDAVKTAIGSHFTLPILTLTRLGQDLDTAIRGHFADTASVLTAATGELHHVSDAMDTPLPPDYRPPTWPPSGPAPGPSGPSGPINAPGSPPGHRPPSWPSGPSQAPGIAPGGGYGPNPAPGGGGPGRLPVPSVPLTSDHPDLAAHAIAGHAAQLTRTATYYHASNLPATVGNCNVFDPYCPEIQPPPGPPKPPDIPVVNPDGSCGLIQWLPGFVCDVVVCWNPGYQPVPCPVTSQPTPTPAPTPDPTPTPSNGCPPPPCIPICPTPGPSPTPTPTPTPSPKPTPKPPPGCIPGATEDCPPDNPCPAGFQWHWTGKYWECLPDKVPLTPPEPFPPTPPTPPPPPVPPGGSAPPEKDCGSDNRDPCWVASNPPEKDLDPFYVTSGFGKALADDDGANPDIQVNAGISLPGAAQLNEFVVGAQTCTIPYQFSLIPEGTTFHDYFTQIVDPKAVFDQARATARISEQAGWNPVLWVGIGIWMMVSAIWGLLTDQVFRIFAALNDSMLTIAKSNVLFNIMNFICLGSLGKLRKIKDYTDNLTMPVGIPTASEAASAWLANEIDECTFKTYVMANDTNYESYKPIALSGKFKFSALETYTLFKREGMRRGDLDSRLRELGSLYPTDRAELDSLFTQIPGPGDIIRFMQRDTQNPKVVNTFSLDDGFTDNFNGVLKDWAKYQGIPDEVMVNEWRAHWSIPSPTQLYEMFHKLRDDPQWGGKDKVQSDVETALRQQDILPYWIPRLLAVTYHPLTRTDLLRAYTHGWISDDDYLIGMHKNGYSDDDSKTLMRFASEERKITVRNSDFGREYRMGHIGMDDALEQAHNEGFDPSVDGDIRAILEPMRAIEFKAKLVDALLKQYRACRISEDEFRKEADKFGIDSDVINWNLSWAGENTSCGSRREMAGALCQALDQGIITAEEYVSRMKKLKYDDVAINTMLALCQNKIQAAKAKAEAARQKAEQRQEQQAERQQQAAERKAAAQANRLSRAIATQERRRQARNRVLEAAAAKLNETLSDANGNGATIVKGVFATLTDQGGLSQDEAAAVISTVAAKSRGMDVRGFTEAAAEAARASLAEPWILFPGLIQNGQG